MKDPEFVLIATKTNNENKITNKNYFRQLLCFTRRFFYLFVSFFINRQETCVFTSLNLTTFFLCRCTLRKWFLICIKVNEKKRKTNLMFNFNCNSVLVLLQVNNIKC